MGLNQILWLRIFLSREWQLGTIQVDYNLPERFELEYTGADNQKHRPVMIHKLSFEPYGKIYLVLIEHCGGNFPLWANTGTSYNSSYFRKIS